MKQFLSFNDQAGCYQCLCEFFNIFRWFRFENWNDNSVSINSIFIDKIDSLDSKIDNYRLLTTKSFIDFYRISKKSIEFYRLLSNAIDYRFYRLTTSGLHAIKTNNLPNRFHLCYQCTPPRSAQFGKLSADALLVSLPLVFPRFPG